MKPLFPKSAIQEYILTKKFVQKGIIIKNKSSCLCFDLAIQYEIGIASKTVKIVINIEIYTVLKSIVKNTLSVNILKVSNESFNSTPP